MTSGLSSIMYFLSCFLNIEIFVTEVSTSGRSFQSHTVLHMNDCLEIFRRPGAKNNFPSCVTERRFLRLTGLFKFDDFEQLDQRVICHKLSKI